MGDGEKKKGSFCDEYDNVKSFLFHVSSSTHTFNFSFLKYPISFLCFALLGYIQLRTIMDAVSYARMNRQREQKRCDI